MFPDETWLLGYTEDLEWANKILRDSAQLDIANAGVNSPASDFAACLVEGRVLFSSGRSEGKGSRSAYSWNDQSYLNLFEADLGADSTLTGASVMDNEANTRYHEGSVAYDAYNKTLYFTRNQFYKGQKDRAKDGTLRLAIYSARYEKGELGRLKPFKHGQDQTQTIPSNCPIEAAQQQSVDDMFFPIGRRAKAAQDDDPRHPALNRDMT